MSPTAHLRFVWCHAPLYITYLKIPQKHPEKDSDLVLAIEIKAINDPLSTERFRPSALTFGEPLLFRFYQYVIIPRNTLPERAIFSRNSRKLMNQQLVRAKIQTATNRKDLDGCHSSISYRQSRLDCSRRIIFYLFYLVTIFW